MFWYPGITWYGGEETAVIVVAPRTTKFKDLVIPQELTTMDC